VGLGGEWGPAEEKLHPRDRFGRFRRKLVSVPNILQKVLRWLDSEFKPHQFGSNSQAGRHLYAKKKPNAFGNDYHRLHADYDEANAQLLAGKMDPSTQKFVDMMNAEMQPTTEHLIGTSVVPPEAFGLTPEQMNVPNGDFDGLIGAEISNPSYQAAWLGDSATHRPGMITMTYAIPDGTNIAIPGRHPDDRGFFFDRNQNFVVTSTQSDGRGGWYMKLKAENESKADTSPLMGAEPRGVGLTPQAREAQINERREFFKPKEAEQQAARQERIRQLGVETKTIPTTPAVQREEQRIAEIRKVAPQGPLPRPEEPSLAPTPRVVGQDFRNAAKAAKLFSAPSPGKRRIAYNKAWQGMASGKRDPEDVLRDLDSDIEFNKVLQARGEGDQDLPGDIQKMEDLAKVIRESNGLGAPQKPAKLAAPPRKVAPKVEAAPILKKGQVYARDLAPGSKILVTKGRDGQWKPTARGKGTPVTVTSLNRIGAPGEVGRIGIRARDNDGNEIDLFGGELGGAKPAQKFLEAPPGEIGKPAKKAAPSAAPAKKAAPGPVKKAAPAKAAKAAPVKKAAPAVAKKAVPGPVKKAAPAKAVPGAEGDLDKMSKAQLLDYAEKHGVTVRKSWTKPQILAAIRGEEGAKKPRVAKKAAPTIPVRGGGAVNLETGKLVPAKKAAKKAAPAKGLSDIEQTRFEKKVESLKGLEGVDLKDNISPHYLALNNIANGKKTPDEALRDLDAKTERDHAKMADLKEKARVARRKDKDERTQADYDALTLGPRKRLQKEIDDQEKTAAFIRDHFKGRAPAKKAAPAKVAKKTAPEAGDIDRMTKADLLKYAKDKNIEGVRPSWTKDRIKTHIRQSQGIAEPGEEVRRENLRIFAREGGDVGGAPIKEAAPAKKAAKKAAPVAKKAAPAKKAAAPKRVVDLRDMAEGLDMDDDDSKMLDYIQNKADGKSTIFRGKDKGKSLTKAEIADELEDMRMDENRGPRAQANRAAFKGDLDAAEKFFKQDERWGKLEDKIRGRKSAMRLKEERLAKAQAARKKEILEQGPAPVKKAVKKSVPAKAAPARKNVTEDYLAKKEGFGLRGSAEESVDEIIGDIDAGKYDGKEGIRRLDSDIEINTKDITDLNTQWRSEKDSKKKVAISKKARELRAELAAEKRARTWMKDYFKAPAKKVSPMTSRRRDVISARVPSKPTVTAKVAPAKKAAKKAVPEKAHVDVKDIAKGLKLRTAQDRRMMDLLQGELDKGKSPAAVGRRLEVLRNSSGAPGVKRGYLRNIGIDQKPGESDERFLRRQEKTEAQADILKAQDDEWGKLADRLKATRRTPAKKAAPAKVAKKAAPAKVAKKAAPPVKKAAKAAPAPKAPAAKKAAPKAPPAKKAVKKALPEKKVDVADFARQVGIKGDAGGRVPGYQRDLDGGMNRRDVADRIRRDAERLDNRPVPQTSSDPAVNRAAVTERRKSVEQLFDLADKVERDRKLKPAPVAKKVKKAAPKKAARKPGPPTPTEEAQVGRKPTLIGAPPERSASMIANRLREPISNEGARKLLNGLEESEVGPLARLIDMPHIRGKTPTKTRLIAHIMKERKKKGRDWYDPERIAALRKAENREGPPGGSLAERLVRKEIAPAVPAKKPPEPKPLPSKADREAELEAMDVLRKLIVDTPEGPRRDGDEKLLRAMEEDHANEGTFLGWIEGSGVTERQITDKDHGALSVAARNVRTGKWTPEEAADFLRGEKNPRLNKIADRMLGGEAVKSARSSSARLTKNQKAAFENINKAGDGGLKQKGNVHGAMANALKRKGLIEDVPGQEGFIRAKPGAAESLKPPPKPLEKMLKKELLSEAKGIPDIDDKMTKADLIKAIREHRAKGLDQPSTEDRVAVHLLDKMNPEVRDEILRDMPPADRAAVDEAIKKVDAHPVPAKRVRKTAAKAERLAKIDEGAKAPAKKAAKKAAPAKAAPSGDGLEEMTKEQLRAEHFRRDDAGEKVAPIQSDFTKDELIRAIRGEKIEMRGAKRRAAARERSAAKKAVAGPAKAGPERITSDLALKQLEGVKSREEANDIVKKLNSDSVNNALMRIGVMNRDGDLRARRKRLVDHMTPKSMEKPLRGRDLNDGDQVIWEPGGDEPSVRGLVEKTKTGNRTRTHINWENGRREPVTLTKDMPNVRRLSAGTPAKKAAPEAPAPAKVAKKAVKKAAPEKVTPAKAAKALITGNTRAKALKALDDPNASDAEKRNALAGLRIADLRDLAESRGTKKGRTRKDLEDGLVKNEKAPAKATPAKKVAKKAAPAPAKKAAPVKKAAPERSMKKDMEVLSRGGQRGIDEGVPLKGDPEGDGGLMHGDSASMELAQKYARKKRNGTANRLMELRHSISTTRGEDSKDLDGPQKLVDELKKLRDAETDPDLRRELDGAIKELDFPKKPIPHLPDGTPPKLRELVENLNRIPVARAPKGSRLHGYTVGDEGSLVERLAKAINDVHTKKGEVSIGTVEQEIEDILHTHHESIDGSYRTWGLWNRVQDDKTLSKQLRDWMTNLRAGTPESRNVTGTSKVSAPDVEGKKPGSSGVTGRSEVSGPKFPDTIKAGLQELMHESRKKERSEARNDLEKLTGFEMKEILKGLDLPTGTKNEMVERILDYLFITFPKRLKKEQ
jgi:hypothetical protein